MYARMQLVGDGKLVPFQVSYPTKRLLVENTTSAAAKVQLPPASPFDGATIELPAMSGLVDIPASALPLDFDEWSGNAFIDVGGQPVLVKITAASVTELDGWLGATYGPTVYTPAFV